MHKPGGALVRNLISGGYNGTLRIVNPKEDEVQGIKVFHDVADIPPTDLAVLVIPAPACPDAVELLASQKEVKAFIIISAGFGEETKAGAELEQRILDSCERYGAALIGPNCIGLMNSWHHSVFTKPIPTLHDKGIDFISGSGATAVFILESAVIKGLPFNSVWSVGNSKQIGIEDVLQYMDENFDPARDSHIKLRYIDNISELTTVGCIFTLPPLTGRNFAIVTHAGGPGVMLTDALSKGGLNVPKLEGPEADELKSKLFPGSSVSNPIDILATGTPEHLALAIDYCENKFKDIDAIFVIFGTPGLVQLYEAYDVLHKKILECKKPIFPILPCLHTAGPEVAEFLKKGHVNFSDEVTLATALTQVMKTPRPASPEIELFGVDVPRIREVIGRIDDNGYISPEHVHELLECAGIPMVPEKVSDDKAELTAFAERVGYPVVAKVVGPVHKSDVGGVALNIRTAEHLALEFDRMMQIEGAKGIMVQKMLKGRELFIGAKYEPRFGHIVLCGLGGIFVEVLKDVSSGLAPLSYDEAYSMIHSLRAYKIIKGTRGQKGINEKKFAEIIVRLSTLLRFATEIKEMDINPLLADENDVVAVDARIRIEKNDN